jgi:hypothetical protein
MSFALPDAWPWEMGFVDDGTDHQCSAVTDPPLIREARLRRVVRRGLADPWVFQVPGAELPRHRGPSRAVALTASVLSGRSPANGASIRSRRQDFELGRPGMWLRMDFEKPPSTQMSWPVT